ELGTEGPVEARTLQVATVRTEDGHPTVVRAIVHVADDAAHAVADEVVMVPDVPPTSQVLSFGKRYGVPRAVPRVPHEEQLQLLEQTDLGSGGTPEIDADTCVGWNLRQKISDRVIHQLSAHAVAQNNERFAVALLLILTGSDQRPQQPVGDATRVGGVAAVVQVGEYIAEEADEKSVERPPDLGQRATGDKAREARCPANRFAEPAAE